MKPIMTAVLIGLTVIGVLTVAASIVVPMTAPAPTLDEAVAIIGGAEGAARGLLDELYALDSRGLWTALGIAGGIVALIGGVPLTVTALRKPHKKAK